MFSLKIIETKLKVTVHIRDVVRVRVRFRIRVGIRIRDRVRATPQRSSDV